MSEQHQALVAARAWFIAARLEWLRDFPDTPCPVPVWEDVNEQGRAYFVRVLRRTLKAADPKNVEKVVKRLQEQGREL